MGRRMSQVTVDDQLVDLQSRLAFQEDSIQSFSDQLMQQSKDLERLQIQVLSMHKRLQEMTRQLEDREQPDDSPPPHY